jgi:Flp pilus assembly protein TadD
VNVNMGLVEGLAVAADERADELTLHQWAAAMRALKLAPDIRGIVGPVGFWRQSAARAYTLSGSFLRFLGERYGPEKLRAALREGDFEAAYARPLGALASEWEAFLDGQSLDARALHAAQVRFERGSLFDRPCAREMAELRGEAEALQRADPERALSLYRRCERIEPENPAHLRAQAELLDAQGDSAAARAAWQKILELPGAAEGARAQALMGLGDAAWEAGDPGSAREAFEKALSLHRDRATDRSAAVKLEALSDPDAAAVLRRYFQRGAELPEVLAVQELSQRKPASATLRYLVGRQLFQHGDGAGAARYLDEALALGLSNEEVRREAWRVLVRARYLEGDGAGARLATERLAEQGDESDKAFAEDWRQRCAFEERTFGGLLAPPR